MKTIRLLLNSGPQSIVLFFVLSLGELPVFPQSDTIPPVLRDFSISPNIVDTSASNAVIALNTHLTDELSGLGAILSPYYLGATPRFTIEFRSATGLQRATALVEPDQIVPGDGKEGSFRSTLVLPRFAEGGLWTLFSAQFYDAAGNVASYDATDFERLRLPFQFTNTSAGDTKPPELLDILIKPTSEAPTNRSFKITLRVKDDLAGAVPFWSSSQIYFTAVGPGRTQSLSGSVLDRVAGDLHDGTYQAIFYLPKFAQPGTWFIDRLLLGDAAGNIRTMTFGDLFELGLPAQFQVQGGPADVTPPELIDLKIETPRVSTAAAGQTVKFNLQVKDDLSGLFEAIENGNRIGQVGLRLESPSKKQTAIPSYVPDLIASTNDIYHFEVGLPLHAEGGVWHISAVLLTDAAGNSTQISTGQLVARGFPVEVINDDPPPLSITKTGRFVGLVWPRDPEGYRLETASKIGTNDWEIVKEGFISSIEENICVLPVDDSFAFFRLRQAP